MQHPSSGTATFRPPLVKGDTPVNGGATPATVPSSYTQQCVTTLPVSPGLTSPYSPARLMRILQGSPEDDESSKDSTEPSSKPTVVLEVPPPEANHHHDYDFSQSILTPWYIEEGDFENKDEDLSVASSVATLWSTRVDPQHQEAATFNQDASAVMGKLGLQVTSLATPEPLTLSWPRQRAVFSSPCGVRLCKGFSLAGLTAAASAAPGSGDHSGLKGAVEKEVRPQESGDNISREVRFDSESATPWASAVPVALSKGSDIHQRDGTCPRCRLFDMGEANCAPSRGVCLKQARTVHHSKLTTQPSCSDSDSTVPTFIPAVSPTMTSPQRTKMTINKGGSSNRSSASTGKSWKQCLARNGRNRPTLSVTRHTRTECTKQVPLKACCISTTFKRCSLVYSERRPSSNYNKWNEDTLETTCFPSTCSTSGFPTINLSRPRREFSERLVDDVVKTRAEGCTEERNKSREGRIGKVSAPTFRTSPPNNGKIEPPSLVEEGTPRPDTTSTIKTENGELDTEATVSVVTDKNNAQSPADFFSDVTPDPHFTSAPVTIHKYPEDYPYKEDVSWKGFDMFPHSAYFKTFETFPALAGAEERSVSMPADVYESVSTGHPLSKRLVLKATTDIISRKQCIPSSAAEIDVSTASPPYPPPSPECASSVDAFFTVTSFGDDSLSTVLCTKTNGTCYSASTIGTNSDSHHLSPGISQQDLINLSVSSSSCVIKSDGKASAATTQQVPTACQTPSTVTSQGQDGHSNLQGSVHGPGCSRAVRLLSCLQDYSTASHVSNHDAWQNPKQVGSQNDWSSSVSHSRQEDKSSGSSGTTTPMRFLDSDGWRMFLSSAEAKSSASPSDVPSFYSYDDDFSHIRAIQNDMLPFYLKLSSTTGALIPAEYRPLRLRDSEDLFGPPFTSSCPRLIRGTSLKSASSDTTIARSEASRSILCRPSATSISMPDLNHLHEEDCIEERVPK